jgi:uncharacterized repeat protein (TIGR01451 family)
LTGISLSEMLCGVRYRKPARGETTSDTPQRCAFDLRRGGARSRVRGDRCPETKSGPGQTKAPIFRDSFNKSCPGGFGANKKQLGVLNAGRVKGLATFRGKLHGAEQGTYAMNLYDSDCALLFKVGSFDVDGSGDGNFAEQTFLCGGQTFFMDFYNQDTDTHNSTKFFKLGSSGPGGTPSCEADLSITKTVDNPTPNVGDIVTFTVTLTNSGPGDATGVKVTDALPDGLLFESATASKGTYDEGTGVWNIETVGEGASETLTIEATVTSADPGENTATITHVDQSDSNSGNDSDSVGLDVQAADLAVDKKVSPASAAVGDPVTFTVTLSDNGPDDATNVTVQDALPAGYAFVSATPSEGATTPAPACGTSATSRRAARKRSRSTRRSPPPIRPRTRRRSPTPISSTRIRPTTPTPRQSSRYPGSRS